MQESNIFYSFIKLFNVKNKMYLQLTFLGTLQIQTK